MPTQILTMGRTVLSALLILAFLSAIVLPVMAQQTEEVNIIKGAGEGQGCVTANDCFDPSTADVASDTTVTWKNEDQVSHTVTSGNPSDNQTGSVFDSNLIAPGKEFSFTFKNAGTYSYFCQVHPWMTGEVVVSASSSTSAPEFGHVAPLILITSITSVLIISSRKKLFRISSTSPHSYKILRS